MRDDELLVASSYGAAGASTRVRALDWLRHLRLPATIHSYLGTADVRPGTLREQPIGVVRAEMRLRAMRLRPAPARVMISRTMGPFTRGRVEAGLLHRARWGVYDFDDALWADVRPGVHRIFGQPVVWERAVRSADQVIAGNAYLAEAAAALNPEVRVIPSCVEPSDYRMKREYALGPVPRLVWMGSPSTEPYLQVIAPALLSAHRETGARLTLVSAGQRPLGELDRMVDRVPWRGAQTHDVLAAADIGIMPLPDTAFTRGKCAYKLLQYGASGLPVIASPVGVNAEVIGQLGGVPAAGSTACWLDAVLGVLGESDAARAARGRRARTAVEELYSFAAWRPEFLRALHLPGDVGSPDACAVE